MMQPVFVRSTAGCWLTLLLAVCANAASVHVELRDRESGNRLPGLIQIRDGQGKIVALSELLCRGFGLEGNSEIHQWWVLPEPRTIELTPGTYSIRAFSGLDTEITEAKIEVAAAPTTVSLDLRRFFDARRSGLRSANTHLHMKQISREQADRYLVEVPLADGLDVLFVSYLERAIADLEYTTNKYTSAELQKLELLGVQIGNGEEHRHNFTASDEGYGHVMLLNIPELVQPVSIGPGITLKGTDGPPLRVGIERARSLGSTIIWCHNQWGLEDIPNWISGRLHANNIFDGGTHGSYEHSFYRYLNAGIKVPFSTGTDWFMYDFSRVYVPASKPLSASEWLDVLRQGRTWITNGPMLEFKVAGKSIGDTHEMPKGGPVSIEARVVGRIDFQRLEIVQNGAVIAQSPARRKDNHFVAELNVQQSIDESCWLALRTPPPPIKDDPKYQTPVAKNDLGGDLFAHSSAVHIQVSGRPQFHVPAGQQLLEEMLTSRQFILARAKFADSAQRDEVLASYDTAILEMQRRLAMAAR